jgi:uncharacterized protein YoaH (UPF0181 family)
VQSVKQDEQEEFLIASDEELEAAGLPGNKESRRLLSALAKGRVPQTLQNRSVVTLLNQGFLAVVGEALRQSARKRIFTNKESLRRALEYIRGDRYRLRGATEEALSCIKRIPPQKKTGPEPKLTDAQKRDACNAIETLKANGMTTKYAIAQTAKRFKVLPRMIRRTWESSGR